jgi:hypothetical protein
VELSSTMLFAEKLVLIGLYVGCKCAAERVTNTSVMSSDLQIDTGTYAFV